ncbi:alpha/beta hydrolase [Phaeobacter marinintestinus]|uniref:alpha/beta hydrolase n=1 Tax=Falsiphaeobacter marinintestinus TaxID=1492905 RepID=UPI0011B83EE3|nr:alpha/beta hydrolase [Phaeobacter marinintestinus]
MDYKTLIDDDLQAFLQQMEDRNPDGSSDLSVEEKRRLYDAQCRDFSHGYPDGVTSETLDADGVPVRVYLAGHPTRTVLFFHGGGFVFGGLDSHDDICAELCAQTGYRIVAVDYRLAPEHPHPAAFDDGWTAAQWAARTFSDPVVLVGDSAGANLAAAVAHHARGQLNCTWGQVLIYPWLGDETDAGSRVEHANAPILTRNDLLAFRDARLTGPEPQNDPTFAPLQDSDFSGLPRTVIFSAEFDPLRDDARDYYDRLQHAGVQVHWIDEPGLVHGYVRARHAATRARDSFERISVAIEALGQDIWPWD